MAPGTCGGAGEAAYRACLVEVRNDDTGRDHKHWSSPETWDQVAQGSSRDPVGGPRDVELRVVVAVVLAAGRVESVLTH